MKDTHSSKWKLIGLAWVLMLGISGPVYGGNDPDLAHAVSELDELFSDLQMHQDHQHGIPNHHDSGHSSTHGPSHSHSEEASAHQCFVGGTKVLVQADGANHLISIEDVQPGVSVWACDTEQGRCNVRKIKSVMHSAVKELIGLTLKGENGREQLVQTTPSHPFYLRNDVHTTMASDLRHGDLLWAYQGSSEVQVMHVESLRLQAPVRVYNFEVDGPEGSNNYFVSEHLVLVHNCTPGEQILTAIHGIVDTANQAVEDFQEAAQYAAEQHVQCAEEAKERGDVATQAVCTVAAGMASLADKETLPTTLEVLQLANGGLVKKAVHLANKSARHGESHGSSSQDKGKGSAGDSAGQTHSHVRGPSESKQWKAQEPYRDGIRTSGQGKNRRFYEWDRTHNDIEVYDRKGNHLGSMEPTTGEIYKSAVTGRNIKDKL